MLLALLALPLARGPERAPPVTTPAAAADAVLRDIAQKISTDGGKALTGPEKLIWNTAVAVSFITRDKRIGVPRDAKILNWGAARAGFREMGLPDLAEFVRLFVLELAYRADLDGRDGEANSASLLRIAELMKRFRAVEAEVDFPLELSRMIERQRKT